MKIKEIEIIYEDEEMIVVMKPSGILVLPDRIKTQEFNIKTYFESKYPELYIVHRIDRDTSGILILAKTAAAHRELSLQFQNRKVQKTYLALVNGKPINKMATITLKIAENKAHKGTYMVHHSGQDAITHYEVIEEFRQFSLLKIMIETGRTHQIRVHMSAIKHPLAVDPIYGVAEKTGIFLSQLKRNYKLSSKDDFEERPLIGRLTLHAHQLTIQHPTTNKTLMLEAPLPKDFAMVLKQLREFGK